MFGFYFAAFRVEKVPPNSKKPYDPSMYSEISDEMIHLQESQNKCKLLENDYKMLHDKRLQDVSTVVKYINMEIGFNKAAVC